MKIKRPDTIKAVDVGNIMPGDVFEFPGGQPLYMMVEHVRIEDGYVRCVCLNNGQLLDLMRNKQVHPVNATVCVDDD